MDGNDSHEQEQRDAGHDRWLAMQSAYSEYRRASEELECTRQSADDSHERLKLPVLEGYQWDAFERYFEARMEFLEARFDESNWPSAGVALPSMPDTEHRGTHSWLTFGYYKPVLHILAVILLGTMAFSLLREQKRVRDLEAARDELQATLNQTRDGLRLLGQKLDAWGATQHSGLQEVEHTVRAHARRAPAAPPHTAGRRLPGAGVGQSRRQSGLHVPQKPIAAKREPAAATGSSSGGRPIFRVGTPARNSSVDNCAQCASGSGRS
jgi:hypothetical protein